MSLAAAIRRWDRKSADDIAVVYREFASQKTFSTLLLDALADAELQAGASWLLKAWLEDGNLLSAKDSTRLLNAFPELQDWAARLHCLQSLPFIEIPASCEQPLGKFLHRQLTHDNKFVRAWAYNGFALLGRNNARYREEAESLFEMAMRDEAPSVKARIRQIQKSK